MAIDVPQLASIDGIQWFQADESTSDVTKTIIVRGKAAHGALFNNRILDALRDSYIGEYGYYVGHNVRYGGGGRIYDEIDITCIDLNLNIPQPAGYYSRFEASSRTESRPLEEKIAAIATDDEVYATWWNHRVVSTNKSESITAADWKAVTDTKLPAGYAGTTARWVKTSQALKTGEYTILEARFPGVQSYGVGAEQVKEVIYTRKESVIKNIIKSVGALRAPQKADGEYYDSTRTDDTKWLITSSSYSRRVGWYEATVNYAYAKNGWLAQGAEGSKTGVYPTWADVLA